MIFKRQYLILLVSLFCTIGFLNVSMLDTAEAKTKKAVSGGSKSTKSSSSSKKGSKKSNADKKDRDKDSTSDRKSNTKKDRDKDSTSDRKSNTKKDSKTDKNQNAKSDESKKDRKRNVFNRLRDRLRDKKNGSKNDRRNIKVQAPRRNVDKKNPSKKGGSKKQSSKKDSSKKQATQDGTSKKTSGTNSHQKTELGSTDTSSNLHDAQILEESGEFPRSGWVDRKTLENGAGSTQNEYTYPDGSTKTVIDKPGMDGSFIIDENGRTGFLADGEPDFDEVLRDVDEHCRQNGCNGDIIIRDVINDGANFVYDPESRTVRRTDDVSEEPESDFDQYFVPKSTPMM